MNYVVGALSGAGFLFTLFYKGSDYLERAASPEVKADLSEYLRKHAYENLFGGLPDILVRALNRFFGERHFSLRCLFRSCLLTVLALAALFTFSFLYDVRGTTTALEVYSIMAAKLHIKLSPSLFLYIVGWCCFIDYANLFKSRIIIDIINVRALTARAFTFVAFADFVFSIAVFFYSATAAVSVLFSIHAVTTLHQAMTLPNFGSAFAVSWGIISGFGGAILIGRVTTFLTSVPAGDFYWASIVPSVWVWGYVAAACLIRLLARMSLPLRYLNSYLLDTRAHPIRSVGFMAGCLAAGLFLLGCALRHL